MKNLKNNPTYFDRFIQFPINKLTFTQENLNRGYTLEQFEKALSSTDACITRRGTFEIGIEFNHNDSPKLEKKWMQIIAKHAHSAKKIVWDIKQLAL